MVIKSKIEPPVTRDVVNDCNKQNFVNNNKLIKNSKKFMGICIVILFLVIIFLSNPISAYSTGFPGSATSGCSCHGSSDVTVSVEINGLPTNYMPNNTYSLTIIVYDGTSETTGGFDLEVDKGTFSNPGANAKLENDKEVLHSITSSRTWTVVWTAPPAGSGSVLFNVAGLADNGDGTSIGDKWNTATYSSTEAGAAASIETIMTLFTRSEASQGDDILISAILTDINGNLLPDVSIEFYRTTTFGTLKIGEDVTDSNGIANISHSVTYSAIDGSIDITAAFQGTSGFEASSITEDIAVETQEQSQLDHRFTGIILIVLFIVGSVWMIIMYVILLLYSVFAEGKT